MLHPRKPHKCPDCRKPYGRCVCLQTGAKRPKDYSCSHCPKSFIAKSSLRRHVLIHSRDSPLRCESCPRTFNYDTNLKKHLLVHAKGTTSVPRYVCYHCCRVYSRKNRLKEHIQTHLGKYFHVCPKCSTPFVNRRNLQRHMLIHEGEKNYPCPMCPKLFSSPSCLKRHLSTMRHTESRPFSCPQCSKEFSQERLLYSHLDTHLKRINKALYIPGFDEGFEDGLVRGRHRRKSSQHRLSSRRPKERFSDAEGVSEDEAPLEPALPSPCHSQRRPGGRSVRVPLWLQDYLCEIE